MRQNAASQNVGRQNAAAGVLGKMGLAFILMAPVWFVLIVFRADETEWSNPDAIGFAGGAIVVGAALLAADRRWGPSQAERL